MFFCPSQVTSHQNPKCRVDLKHWTRGGESSSSCVDSDFGKKQSHETHDIHCSKFSLSSSSIPHAETGSSSSSSRRHTPIQAGAASNCCRVNVVQHFRFSPSKSSYISIAKPGCFHDSRLAAINISSAIVGFQRSITISLCCWRVSRWLTATRF
jgi:hypothetical protein